MFPVRDNLLLLPLGSTVFLAFLSLYFNKSHIFLPRATVLSDKAILSQETVSGTKSLLGTSFPPCESGTRFTSRCQKKSVLRMTFLKSTEQMFSV